MAAVRTLWRGVLATALVCAASAPPPAGAAPRTLKWEDGLCGYSMRYDDVRIDRQALENTVDLLKSDSQSVPIAHSPFKTGQLHTIDPDRFELDCARTAAKARNAALLDFPGIEDFRRGRVATIEDACRYGVVSLRGLKDPAAFRDYAPAAGACDAYVDALEGKTDLATTWRTLVDQRCARNVDPRNCRANFEKTAQSGVGDEGMRLTVGTFGWNNCATQFASFNGRPAEQLAEMGRKVAETFNKRYGVRETCDSD